MSKRPTAPDAFCDVGAIHGFPDLFGKIGFGSTLLLSGPPGAGKSTFALATVRAMMAGAKKAKLKEKTIAYYVSSEVAEERLLNNFKSFGWFLKSKQIGEDAGFKFVIDSPVPDETNFYAITPMPEVDRPVPSPEELVNGIFNRILHTLLPGESPTEHAKIYVIVDSITALLKGCSNTGEERRQTHEIMRRLQDRFGEDHLALTILLAEHDHGAQYGGSASAPIAPTEPSVEDYLADIVFRLYLRSLPLGRRSRILEVVKSQGVNMTLGEHTWQVVSKDNCKEIFRLEDFQKHVELLCCHPERVQNPGRNPDPKPEKPEWGGIVIFPRPRLQIPPWREQQKGAPTSCGTSGLELNVAPGSITLIMGPMACGKETLCRQFLTDGDDYDPNKRVLISFDVPAAPATTAKPLTRLHFTQSQFDLNVLVAHINWILDHGCERLAFDGLSDWITMFDKSEAARVLEALMVTMKRKRAKKTPPIFMTYETALDDDPLAPAALGMAADNLVVVRRVSINDLPRTVIYVLKPWPSEDGLTHRHPGELQRTADGEDRGLAVNHTSLEAYKGLLNRHGVVSAARVLIQLFSENEFEKAFNRTLVDRLKDQYAKRVSLFWTTFSLSETGSILKTAFGAGKPGEAFNLAIHSVDEWWLQAKKTGEFLRDLQEQSERAGPSYQDFWWFEVEKSLARIPPARKSPAWHAVPSYLDFGMFCVNLDVLSGSKLLEPLDPARTPREEAGAERAWERERWKKLLSLVPRLWATETDERGLKWFGFGDTKSPTVLGFALEATSQQSKDNRDRTPVFRFDSSTRETCSCMFFELAWAFGAGESFLAGDPSPPDREAAARGLMFLQFMVLEGLLSARSSSYSEDPAGQKTLFSRQWYSTLQKHNEGKAGDSRRLALINPAKTRPSPSQGLVALPFMPTGQASPDKALASLLDDIAVRQHYWVERMMNSRKRFPYSKKAANLVERIKAARDELRAEQDSTRKLAKAITAYSLGRDWLMLMSGKTGSGKRSGGLASERWSADLDDLIELAAWAAFRLRLLFGNTHGQFPDISALSPADPIRRAIDQARSSRHCLPDLGSELSARLASFDAKSVIPTGFVCTGSWMYGVGKDSRSSEIQAQMLAELTSLKSAQDRAKAGAGIPARKDFFHLDGEKPAHGMEYLNWLELLRYGGSRARLRHRMLNAPTTPTPPVAVDDPAPLYGVIHDELLACLRMADLQREDYASGAEEARGEAIESVSNLAHDAVGRIIAGAQACLPLENGG